jgi:hypothetical protein
MREYALRCLTDSVGGLWGQERTAEAREKAKCTRAYGVQQQGRGRCVGLCVCLSVCRECAHLTCATVVVGLVVVVATGRSRGWGRERGCERKGRVGAGRGRQPSVRAEGARRRHREGKGPGRGRQEQRRRLVSRPRTAERRERGVVPLWARLERERRRYAQRRVGRPLLLHGRPRRASDRRERDVERGQTVLLGLLRRQPRRLGRRPRLAAVRTGLAKRAAARAAQAERREAHVELDGAPHAARRRVGGVRPRTRRRVRIRRGHAEAVAMHERAAVRARRGGRWRRRQREARAGRRRAPGDARTCELQRMARRTQNALGRAGRRVGAACAARACACGRAERRAGGDAREGAVLRGTRERRDGLAPRPASLLALVLQRGGGKASGRNIRASETAWSCLEPDLRKTIARGQVRVRRSVRGKGTCLHFARAEADGAADLLTHRGRRKARLEERGPGRDARQQLAAQRGKARTCASSAWRTAAWCGVVSVRVRFFFGGGGGLVCSVGWLDPASASLSAMSPWEDAVEGEDGWGVALPLPLLSPSRPRSIEVLERVAEAADAGGDGDGVQESGVVGDWKTRGGSTGIGGRCCWVKCG